MATDDHTPPPLPFKEISQNDRGAVPDFGRTERNKREAEYQRQKRAARKAAGLCIQCGLVPPRPQKVRCADCARQHGQRHHQRTAQGLCSHYPNSAVPGLTLCNACLERNQAKCEGRRADGLCSQCGRNPAPSGERCQACRDYEQAWTANRRVQGLCLKCDTPTENGAVYCAMHARRTLQNLYARRAEALAAGLCKKCRKEPYVSLENGLCTVCYLKDTALNHLGSRRHWKKPQDLFERQDGRCALSGVPLILGRDTWVDHIVPRSRGGAVHEITNLRWTHAVPNRMKDNVGEGDLRAIITAIYQTMVSSSPEKG